MDDYGDGPYRLMPIESWHKKLRIRNVLSDIKIEIDYDDVEYDTILEETKYIVDLLNAQYAFKQKQKEHRQKLNEL